MTPLIRTPASIGRRAGRVAAASCVVIAAATGLWTPASVTRVLSAHAFTPPPAIAGLVAAYSFDEGTGTAAADASGHGNTGTVSNTSWSSAGRHGGALDFNGLNAWVTVPDSPSLQLTSGLTLEAWVFPTAAPSGWRAVMAKDVDRYYLMAGSDQDRPVAGGTFGAVNQNTVAPGALAVGTWTHLAVTFDGTAVRLYVNGAEVASQPQTAAVSTSSDALHIGGDVYGEFFTGRIDEVRIYNVGLTAEQIQADMATPIAGTVPLPPDLTLAKSHTGTFAQGQIGASYRLSVGNIGAGPTDGIVSVTDVLPAGLSASAIGGPGWSCVLQTLTCTRSDTLAAGALYPSITVTVDVAGNAAASVTNSASVSGGGDADLSNNTGSDPTTIMTSALPDLTLTKAHGGAFARGQIGAGYTLTVHNGGSGPTAGTVSVVDTLPAGLSASAMSGSGWTCTLATLTCTRTDALPAGSAYPPIALTVNVTASAPASVTNTASVSGGGDSNTSNNGASDPTTIVVPPGGLVAAYAFDEGAGTTAADATGHTHTGALTNTTWTTAGRFGGALDFNGLNAWVTVADAPALRLTTGLTLAAWVFPTAAPSGWRAVMAKDVDNYYLMAGSDQNRPVAGGTFGGVNENTVAPDPLAVNTWTHLAMTFDGIAVRLYVNGAEVASRPQTAPAITSADALHIGGDFYGEFFAGRIDEVRIYNVGLTAEQIRADMNTPVGAIVPEPPDLTLGKSHNGAFAQGQVGAAYTLTVGNSGAGATVGPVSVTDTLPAGLTATAIGGPGWTCTLPTLSCTRSDLLPAGATYPAITITVNVAANAPASVTNLASVSGAGDADASNNTASDPTSITGLADLTLTKAHTRGFARGQVGTSYTLTVHNGGLGPTTGPVAVADTLPAGLIASAMSGAGWSCTVATLTCTRSDVLAAGGTWPLITLTVNVAVDAPATVTNTASVSGGGDANPSNNGASDPTVIAMPPSGLVAAYGFDEGAGSTAGDSSGNTHTGTVSNTTWTTAGRFGGALDFNGLNAWVTVADAAALRLTTGLTLEAWVFPTATLSGWRAVMAKDVDNYYLMASSDQNRPVAGGTFGSLNPNTVGPDPLPLNTWTHLAMTFDSTAVRLYVNGAEVASRPQTAALITSTDALHIGGDVYGEFFPGRIDEVRIYNVALTAAQIQSDMDTPIGAIVPSPADLAVGKSHAGTFTQGQPGAVYTLTVTNVGSGPTAGGVSVTDTLPAGLTATAIAGPGWSCTLATVSCSRSDVLAAGASYPAITVTVSVAANAPASVTNTASVSGGGDVNGSNNSAADLTAIGTSVDTAPPSAPGALTATATSGVEIALSWGAATDNVGVAGYRIERCQGAGCTDFTKFGVTVTTTSFQDRGLTVNTTYRYIVRAEDGAGNLGPYTDPATASTPATNPHLVAAYAFNEGTGSTAADASGYGHTGTVTSPVWTPAGKFGGALAFNGSSTVVTIPDTPALRLAGGMTLAAWVNPGVSLNRWADVIYKGNDNYYLEGGTPGGVPAIGQIVAPATYSEVLAPSPLPVNAWTHLAATYDGVTQRLFVNGVEVGSRPQTGVTLGSANPLQIGGDSIYGQHFQGLIDEVRIYDVALRPIDIQADMATPVGAATVPVATVSPIAVDFGLASIGVPAGPSTITLTNTGGSPLSIGSIAIAGPQSANFTETHTCVSPLAPGTSCSIAVTFTASAQGPRTASLSISDNAPGTPHVVALTGTGASSSVVLAPQATVLTPGQARQFTASGTTGALTWRVDGTAGGSAAAGLITADGRYTAPATAGAHAISVTDSLSQGASATVTVVAHPGIFTHHVDNARTGVNPAETVLTPANVHATSFGKLLAYPTDGISHASPLYVGGVDIPGVGSRNVVYVATEHDSVYAFDADGLSAAPLWHVSFINPAAGITTVPKADVEECCDISPEIGITGTPVIDRATNTLYVVAKTKENGDYVQRLHALDIRTGAEKLGGPVVIAAVVPGSGSGSVNNQLAFHPLRQNQRTALLLLNGVVYFGFGSHGDVQPYHGWVFGYNATTLQRVLAWCASPNGQGAGVWHSGGGIIGDAAGNLYFVTGDGSFSANSGGADYGDSFVGSPGTELEFAL